jgi:hypothetical protein
MPKLLKIVIGVFALVGVLYAGMLAFFWLRPPKVVHAPPNICSKNQDLIAAITAESDQRWHSKYTRTTTPNGDCIEWADDSPALRLWVREFPASYYTSRLPPAGSVSGTTEQNARLKEALQDAAVPFSTKRQGNAEWIYWEARYNDRVHPILKRLWNMDLTVHTADDPNALAEARKSWTVDEVRAKNTVLIAYPNVLSRAHFDGPTVATFTSQPLHGFEDAGRYAWLVSVICNSGGMHASFFVNPVSGALAPKVKPGDKDSAACS